MSDAKIEIYVRNSGERNLLIVHADDEARAASAKAREADAPTAFLELSVLPEWIPDRLAREAYEKSGEVLHLRIPISGDLPF